MTARIVHRRKGFISVIVFKHKRKHKLIRQFLESKVTVQEESSYVSLSNCLLYRR